MLDLNSRRNSMICYNIKKDWIFSLKTEQASSISQKFEFSRQNQHDFPWFLKMSQKFEFSRQKFMICFLSMIVSRFWIFAPKNNKIWFDFPWILKTLYFHAKNIMIFWFSMNLQMIEFSRQN